MLTPQAIEDFKDFLDNNIAFAKVTVNGEVKQIPIHRRERLKDGRVAVYLKQHEAYVLKSFGVKGRGTPEQREAAEIIAARTREVVKEGRR